MEIQDTPRQNDPPQDPVRQINRALGLFICFFGTVVLVSILLTDTFMGKMTNLGAGVILIVIGIIMILGPKRRAR